MNPYCIRFDNNSNELHTARGTYKRNDALFIAAIFAVCIYPLLTFFDPAHMASFIVAGLQTFLFCVSLLFTWTVGRNRYKREFEFILPTYDDPTISHIYAERYY